MTTAPPSPLFHYCSSETFLSILRSRQIHASSLTLSNDTMEGRWIETIFSDLCANDPELEGHKVKLLNIFQHVTQIFGGLGFCLSEVGDLLSQWRGYANNGAGMSIGFNPEYILYMIAKKRRGSLQKVVYDEEKQKESLKPLMIKIKGHIADGALESMFGSLLHTPDEAEKKRIGDASAKLWETLLFASPSIYEFKNPAFNEEKEWRLLDTLANPKGALGLNALAEMDFMAKNDRISPMTTYDLENADLPIILEVFLGPKNITPKEVISAALAKFGFKGVTVSRSSATYR